MDFVRKSTLKSLCYVSKAACDEMATMISVIYRSINADTAKLKADNSYITIADGIVQHLLKEHLYRNKFSAIVGEEDETNVNIVTRPYMVDDLVVPELYYDSIDIVRGKIDELSGQIDGESYADLSVFIDPIDGTREFSTGLGDQCSICIGFANPAGQPVAGIVYRPLSDPITWAAGAKSENFAENHLLTATPTLNGFLTSNGSISEFIVQLMRDMEGVRVPSGGAGNKMLMLLEGRGGCYIQDRGVSRWDTCAAQAVIEAHGGVLGKLSSFIANQRIESYSYIKSSVNQDLEPGLANLTLYNASDKSLYRKGETTPITDAAMAKPYSNLCGLIALHRDALDKLQDYHAAMLRVMPAAPPAYD